MPLLKKHDEKTLAKIIAQAKVAAETLAITDGNGGHLKRKKRKNLEKKVARGKEATNRFIVANLRLVVHFATWARENKYPNVPLLHLIQFGTQGLYPAIRKFEWQRDNRFSTYASDWIVSAITRGVKKDTSGFASLDTELSSDSGLSLHDIMEDKSIPDPADSTNNDFVADVVKEAMKNLKKDDREVLTLLLFGNLNVEEVAVKLGKTTNYVRKRRNRGLEYLKRHEKVKKLKV